MFYRDTQALVIHIPRGTCARGDIIVIHISFALAQHISQRGLTKVRLIVAYFKGVVWELYESPTNSACRVTSFFFVRLNATFFLSALYTNHKIYCFYGVKTLAIIITSGNDTSKVVGFKGTHKN